MPALDPSAIRNVAVVGHRGTGKTSLVEALLFQAAQTNRLGTVEQGTTVSDWDEDEHQRQMSLSASLCHSDWQGTKVNLIDIPGDAGFQADTLAALRVVEGAPRRRQRRSGRRGADVQGLGALRGRSALARVVFVNMLDRERADFAAVLEQIRSAALRPLRRCRAPDRPRARARGGRRPPAHARLPSSRRQRARRRPADIPAEVASEAAPSASSSSTPSSRPTKRSMERYLEGEEIGGDELGARCSGAVARGELVPGGVRRRDPESRHDRAARPARRGRPLARREARGETSDGAAAFVFKTVADPFAGRITVFRVALGHGSRPTRRSSIREPHGKERLGQLLVLQGKEHQQAPEFGTGRHRRRREAQGDADR